VFSAEVLLREGFWTEVMKICLVDDAYTQGEGIIEWGVKDLKSKDMTATPCRLGWNAAVYNIYIYIYIYVFNL
jgi:hypothetical protein